MAHIPLAGVGPGLTGMLFSIGLVYERTHTAFTPLWVVCLIPISA